MLNRSKPRRAWSWTAVALATTAALVCSCLLILTNPSATGDDGPDRAAQSADPMVTEHRKQALQTRVPTRPLKRCTVRSLSLKSADSDYNWRPPPRRRVSLKLENDSRTSCRLWGFPSVKFVTSEGIVVRPNVRFVDDAVTANRREVSPGDVVVFDLEKVVCKQRPRSVSSLVVTALPGTERFAFRATAEFDVCKSSDPRRLEPVAVSGFQRVLALN